ncbi:hypothetical protein GGX14DRAFT_522958 [Mycena pura]|uniref:CUE domain-containing protein n=1 Tax=Mycena pura TaxID=153505 RepID=A0AAD6V753_9AGAR|nr:hypothetical protein GGX14DRAFT_522958 [Mycena pura]
MSVISRLPGYPSAAAWKSLPPSQLSATRSSIAAALLDTAALPPAQRDTPAARNFISTFAKEQARATLEALVWGTPFPPEERLIRKRALVLAEQLADGLTLQTLVDLAIVYARTNATQTRAVLAAGLEATSSEVASALVPALTSLLSASQGLYALRKTSYCIVSFLHVCTKAALRVFAHSKEFILALAIAYDAGLSTVARSYGGLTVSDERDADEWERILVETKVSLMDAFHMIIRSMLDDMVSSRGSALAAEADRTFDIVFALLGLSSPSQPDGQIPFLNRSLLADYQQTYDLSHILAASLRHAEEKDARVDLLESTLQSASLSTKEPGALKILLRSSGITSGGNNLGKGHLKNSDAEGKGKEMSTPAGASNDSEVDVKVTQVLDILPEHEPAYIRALLSHPSYTNPSQVVDALLEGTAPSVEQLQAFSAEADEIGSYERRNIFDDEVMDLSNLRIGKKTDNDSVLRDRTFIEQMKADILRRAEEIPDEEEEEEEGKRDNGKGKGKYVENDDSDSDGAKSHVKVAGDGEESGGEDSDTGDDHHEEALTPETICELAYMRDPKLFDRDAQTRRSKTRADLKAQTRWTDEQLEGWRIMLERNPSKDKILQKHEFSGNRNTSGHEVSTSEVRGDSQRGSGGGRGRGRGGRGGRGRGGGDAGGSAHETARERAWKDKSKASHANHNRKRGHDKKMARAGGPS